MNAAKIAGIVLIIAGAVGLAGFTYTKDSHKADLGPIKISVDEKKTVHVPQIAAYAAIALGLILVVAPLGKKS